MSYRVDIPTLSANEVYTLTFEYEGTETIQLIVGDLTLETTDRRVVFTTTSPINYIESNVNLTNLIMYEGYYESDDFGGEYTQESYIEGKSLINLIQSEKHLDFQNNSCGVETFEDNMIKLTITDASSLTSTWQYGWMKTSANLKVGATYTCVVHVVENSISTEGIAVGASYGTLVHGNASNSLSSGQTGIIVFTYTTATATLKDFNGYYDGFCRVDKVGDWQNGSLKYGIMVFEGDYYDYFVNNNIPYFEGIGCVKSPKIVSHKAKNLVPAFEITSGYGSDIKIEVFDDNKHIEFAHTGNDARLQFRFDVTSIGLTSGDLLGIEFDAITKGVGTVANKTSAHLMFTNIRNIDDKAGTSYFETGHYKNVVEITGNPIQIHFRQNISGANGNEYFIVKNFSVFKINSVDDMKDNYEECVVSTPDDLELYGLSDVQDTLDLTTGTYTQRVKKWNLAEEGYALTSVNQSQEANGYVSFYIRQPQFGTLGNPTCILNKATHINNLGLPNLTEGAWASYSGRCLGVAANNAFLMLKLETTDVPSYDKAGLNEWIKANNFTVYYNAVFSGIDLSITTETYQVNINPLKSYRNGSITTSSQQLTPTLKTTLPISNKFTTTNLTSGSTYNVYFDGTATKLDAGGTIITNPISPCEVECGGTILTIEGTDIQNVRVLETSVKNEVGSVCGTTDVELSRIITECKYHNYFSDYSRYTGVDGGGATTTRENNKVILTTTLSWGRNGYQIPTPLSLGTYKFYCKVKVQNIGDKYRVTLHKNIDGASDVNYGFYKEITSTSLEEVIEYVGYFQDARYITFHGFAVNQVVEYYDISLIKLSDDDITGTDTSSINYSQVISDLEQPIKLRSLGTTYDSYNPVTGELIKRIGVSETDGSYSVLSSPIVISSNYKMLQDNNIILDSFPQVMNSAYVDFLPTQLLPNTTYTVFLDATTASGQLECGLLYNADWYDGVKSFTVGVQSFIYTTNNQIDNFGGFRIRGWGSIINNLIMVQGEYSLDYYNPIMPPQLYTNGQVRVYSDSEVYPTTILNGQSTNNYEINGLNTSNNYTIRYEGECESINLANKSNTQGNNVLVKAGATSGNLTFVNGENIENVMLIESDVSEQEINHFTGMKTVEISRMLIENQRNMYCYKDVSEPYGGYTVSATPIPVQPSETLYCVVYNSVRYSSLVEYDSDMNLLLRTEINVGYGDNGNVVKLTENTYYVKVETGVSFENKVMISRGGFLPLELGENIYQGAYIDLPQPVQLNRIHKENMPYSSWSNVLGQVVNLADGIAYDSYNPITGEYIQRVYKMTLNGDDGIKYIDNWSATQYVIDDNTLPYPRKKPHLDTVGRHAGLIDVDGVPYGASYNVQNDIFITWINYNNIALNLPRQHTNNIFKQDACKQWLRENPIVLFYELETPIVTQLTPIEIPTFEGGTLQLITTDGKVSPMVEYSMPTNNRYDTSSWETGAVYTQRNMTEAYFNESTTPMTPTETMTLTTDHISSGSIILNDNGNGLIVLKGNYTGRDIPYFTGMRSVEAIEVETTPSPDQPLFGKGGRK